MADIESVVYAHQDCSLRADTYTEYREAGHARFGLVSARRMCVGFPLHARHVLFHEGFALVKVVEREAALFWGPRVGLAARAEPSQPTDSLMHICNPNRESHV